MRNLDQKDKNQLTFSIQLDRDNNVYQVSSKEMNCSFPVKATDEQLKQTLNELINEWVDAGFGEHVLPTGY